MINELEILLPAPFLFNSLKHHLQTILDFIKDSKEQGTSVEEISIRLKKVGNSMIDLYFGGLNPTMIGEEIMHELLKYNHFYQRDFLDFINKLPGKYKNVYLSDGSTWTLLAGRDVIRYIHIHPARGSKFTKRVNAIACKTAIFIKIFFEMELMETDLLSLANRVRHDYLEASPVKGLIGTKKLHTILDLL